MRAPLQLATHLRALGLPAETVQDGGTGRERFARREPADDLDDVLRILRRKSRGRLIEKVNVRRANHIEADVEPFPFAAA